MEIIEGRTIHDESFAIDDKIFRDCTLINCVLEYSGRAVAFERTSMRNCKYIFLGRAKRTVLFLQETGLLADDPLCWGELPETVN